MKGSTLQLFRRGAGPAQRLPQLPENLGAAGGPLALPQRLQQVRQLGLGGTSAGPGRQPEAGTAGGGPTEPAGWRGGAGVRHGGTELDTRQ